MEAPRRVALDLPVSDARPIRSFVAIEVEEPARAAILAFLEDVRGRGWDVAWTRPENLHVTLKFLGGVAPALLQALAERLEAIAAAQAPFPIEFACVGAFPSTTRPRVLWVGAAAPTLGALATAVDDASAVAAEVAPERRPYHPHVTLGRVRDFRQGSRPRATKSRRGDVQDIVARDRARPFGVAPASALVLFRSDTGPTGARHTPLARFELG